MRKAIFLVAFTGVFIAILSADCCFNCPPPCDYPFDINFADVPVNDPAGAPASFHWTMDVVNRKNVPQLDEPIEMNSEEEENPVVVVSRFTNEEGSWINVVPFPGVALLNTEGTQIIGALLLIVVWPLEDTEPGASFELGDIFQDIPPKAASFLLYGPTDYDGRIVCLVRLNSGSCEGHVEITNYENNRLGARINGTNYAISESEITSLVEQGTALCEEG